MGSRAPPTSAGLRVVLMGPCSLRERRQLLGAPTPARLSSRRSPGAIALWPRAGDGQRNGLCTQGRRGTPGRTKGLRHNRSTTHIGQNAWGCGIGEWSQLREPHCRDGPCRCTCRTGRQRRECSGFRDPRSPRSNHTATSATRSARNAGARKHCCMGRCSRSHLTEVLGDERVHLRRQLLATALAFQDCVEVRLRDLLTNRPLLCRHACEREGSAKARLACRSFST
jgi:hypothetical protein